MPLPETPEALPHAFAAAWNARDPDALAALFDADAEFVNVVGLWWHDREAIRRAHAYGLETLFPDSTLRVTRTKVKPLAPGVAVVHAGMRLEGQSAVGDVAAPGVRLSRLVVGLRAHPRPRRSGMPSWSGAAELDCATQQLG